MAIDPGGNIIEGNHIGTDLSGTKILANIVSGLALEGPNNTVGGTAPGAGNVIAFNGLAGGGDAVFINRGSPNNVLEMNSIYGNVTGIDHFGGLPKFPDPPVLTSVTASAGNITIQGTVTGPANDQLRVEFFANPSAINAQGQTFLGFTTVTIGANGTGSFNSSFPSSSTGPFITATATDATPLSSTSGTSGFSSVFQPPNNSPDLSLQGTAPNTVAQGSSVTYTLAVANDGNAAATGVKLIDALPANVTFVSATGGVNPVSGVLTFNLGNLAAGAQAPMITIVVTANPAGTLTNSATVNGNEADLTPADNSITQTTTVQTAPAVADLTLLGSAPAAVLLGNHVTYTLTVANGGPLSATGVILTDTLPAGVNFVSATDGVTPVNGVLTFNIGNLAGGAPASFTIVVTPTAAGTLTNTSSVSGNETDPTPADNSLSQTTAVTTTTVVADLVVSGSAPASVVLGQNVTYTLTVRNGGPSVATGVRLIDVLPAGVTFVSATGGVTPVNGALTIPLGNLAAGASTSVSIVVTPTVAGMLIDRVGVAANETDPTPNDNLTALTTRSIAAGVPPIVVALQRFGFHAQPTSLVLTFSTALDPASAQNTANYRIVTLGVSGRGGSIVGHVIAVSAAVYDRSTLTVTLFPAERLDIHNLYQLTVNGSAPSGLAGATGLLLDGTANGVSGSNFVANISRPTLVGPAPTPSGVAQSRKAGHPHFTHEAVPTPRLSWPAQSRKAGHTSFANLGKLTVGPAAMRIHYVLHRHPRG
jgi:uncharacterized repeat protein (TIGR01451 family)